MTGDMTGGIVNQVAMTPVNQVAIVTCHCGKVINSLTGSVRLLATMTIIIIVVLG